MNHKPLLVSALTLLAMAGCAVAPPAAAPAQDKVGDIITKYAAETTASLRALSENEGGTRSLERQPSVVKTPAPAPAVTPVPAAGGTVPLGAYTAPVTREGVQAPQIIMVSYPVAAQPALVAAAPAAAAAPAPAPAPVVTVSSVAPATAAAAAAMRPTVRPADRIVYGAGGVTAAGDALNNIPPGLERRITLVDVTDDVEGLVERISKQVGWIRLPSTGIRISQQPLTMNAVDRPAIEVIRDLSGAIGRQAEIVVTPGTRTFSVQFPTH